MSSIEVESAHRSPRMAAADPDADPVASSGNSIFGSRLYRVGAQVKGMSTESGPRGAAVPSVRMQSSHRQSGGHRKGRPVPKTCAHGEFMLCDSCRDGRALLSTTSVAGGALDVGVARTRTHMHMYRCRHAHVSDSHMRAVPCTRTCVKGHTSNVFLRCSMAQAR